MKGVFPMFSQGMLSSMKFSFSKKVIIRQDRIRKDGTGPINIRVIVNRKPKNIPVGLYVTNAQLGPDGQVKDHPDASDYNMIIGMELNKANEIFKEYRLADRVLTLDQFLRDFFNFDKRKSFLFHYKEDLKSRTDLADHTRELHQNTLNLLTEFGEYRNEKNSNLEKDLQFNDLTLGLLNDLDFWLCKNKKHNHNTRAREHRDVFQYINRAIAQGIRIENPYLNFKWPKTTRSIVFLEQEELRQWTDYYYSPEIKPGHKISLQYFLTMTYTSIRISDAQALFDTTIIGDELVFIPNKTKNTKGQILRIPLSSMAKKFLLDKKGKLLPKRANGSINRDLKEIAKELKSKKRISTKVGRHTFATIFLERGGKVEVLQQILGHSDIEDTMVYVHITDERKKMQMDVAFDNFYAAAVVQPLI
jgi:integrase/recombinase XerD